MAFERSKQAAAVAAAALVCSGMRVGLGTGSTSEFFVTALAERVKSESLDIQVFPTSEGILNMSRDLDLPVLADYPDLTELDFACDGADEVDPLGRLIKGGGGALLREKLVALAAKRFVVMVDHSKHVEALGATFRLPVEVVSFGLTSTEKRIADLGVASKLELRRIKGSEQPFVTDQGNRILDLSFAQAEVETVALLHQKLKQLTGVVETGFFASFASQIVTGAEDGTVSIFRAQA